MLSATRALARRSGSARGTAGEAAASAARRHEVANGGFWCLPAGVGCCRLVSGHIGLRRVRGTWGPASAMLVKASQIDVPALRDRGGQPSPAGRAPGVSRAVHPGAAGWEQVRAPRTGRTPHPAARGPVPGAGQRAVGPAAPSRHPPARTGFGGRVPRRRRRPLRPTATTDHYLPPPSTNSQRDVLATAVRNWHDPRHWIFGSQSGRPGASCAGTAPG